MSEHGHSLTPTEDSGSETLARFRFQVQLAAQAAFDMLLNDDIESIICESHEDYVIVRQDGVEFVSVKHREPDQPPWTIASLCTEGVLSHIYATWSSHRAATTRLQTNNGLRPGANEAAQLAEACASRDQKQLQSFGRTIAERLAQPPHDVTDFLGSLQIQARLPKRDDLFPRLLQYVRERCHLLGWIEDECDTNFRAICDVVYDATCATVEESSRQPTSDARTLHPTAVRARAQAAKTVDRERVRRALARGPAPSNRGTSLLDQKLECGGIGPTGRTRARALQQSWLRVRHRWSSELPGDDLENVRLLVLRCAEYAERQVFGVATTYGADMLTLVEDYLGNEARQLPAYLTGEVLLGLAYDETDRCNIQWSPDPVFQG